MSFFHARIQNDLENLAVPLDYELSGDRLTFKLEIHTKIYDGIFKFELAFPREYPFKSPKLRCGTRVFHPNIDSEGHVCLKILREGWMPTYDLNSILVSLLCSFEYVSGEDALNTEAGDLLEQDFDEFVKRARAASGSI